MIRNLAIIALVALVGFTVISGISDAVSTGKNVTSKISKHHAAINAALEEAQ